MRTRSPKLPDVVADRSQEKTEILAGGDPRLQPRIGRYRLERRLGAGGMAEVFLARSEGPQGFEKQVVVKRIRPQLAANVKFVEMFLREARLLARLDHPNIVRIIELDEDRGEYFLALEYLEGLSLREVAERHWAVGRPLPVETLMQIVADAALGLDYAHNLKEQNGGPANLVHRDVSPDNLFVTTTGTVKVIDFGIAKLEGIDQLTQAGELKGKIPFMSPEQLQGIPLDARCDLFSLGITLYWLLTGRRPFDGVTDVHTMKAILEDPPPPLRGVNPKLPPILEDVVKSLLEKDRDKRIRSAAALHDTLMAMLVGLPRAAPPPSLLVDAAQTLPVVLHEVVPVGLAAVPVLPWPERVAPSVPFDDLRGFERPDRSAAELANASTRQQRVAAVPLPSSKGGGESSRGVPVWAPGHRREEPSTQLVAKDDIYTTAEHSRVSSSPSSLPETEAAQAAPSAASRAPFVPATGPEARAFNVPSDPVIDVERVSAPQPIDDSVTRALEPVRLVPDFVAAAARKADDLPPADHATLELAPVSASFEADELPPPGLFDEPPSRALPVVAGIGSALVVIGVALWLTGAMGELKEIVLGAVPDATDAGIELGSIMTEPLFMDAGEAFVFADAGEVLDAGEEMPEGEIDGGVLDDDDADVVDAGSDRPSIKVNRRTIAVIGPTSVQWQGLAGEVYGAGRGTLRLPGSVRGIYAVDLRRGSKTRINIDSRTRTVDWNKLPRQKLNVRVRPYADVSLGKEKLGTTPLAPVSVVVGTYDVTLVYKTITKTVPVEVKANKPTVLNVVMTK